METRDCDSHAPNLSKILAKIVSFQFVLFKLGISVKETYPFYFAGLLKKIWHNASHLIQ